MTHRDDVPAEVTLAYREVGGAHVFTAQGFRGFHIGSAELEVAFSQIAAALGEHISRLFEKECEYSIEMSFDDFNRHLNEPEGIFSNFVVAKMASTHAHA